MSSPIASAYGRVTTQRNLTILAAVVVALPAAYAFEVAVGAGSASFLLLVVLGVGVPTAYDDYWPRYDETATAVAWVLAACVVATVEFVSLYVLARDGVGLSSFGAGVGAFLVTDLGNLAWLASRDRHSR